MDRNNPPVKPAKIGPVALRKESVDRNTMIITTCIALKVALRKESVDRNTSFCPASLFGLRRSPQGERG